MELDRAGLRQAGDQVHDHPSTLRVAVVRAVQTLLRAGREQAPVPLLSLRARVEIPPEQICDDAFLAMLNDGQTRPADDIDEHEHLERLDLSDCVVVDPKPDRVVGAVLQSERLQVVRDQLRTELAHRRADLHLGDDPRIEVREQISGGKRKPRPKSHHSIRTIPLSPELARQLAAWKQTAEFTAPGEPIFCNEIGRRLDYSALYKRVFKPAKEASGIDWPEGVAFHLFRKTAASLLHHHGKSGRQLADWLGHHDPAFTVATYVGQVDEGLGDASFLDELIPPGGNRTATPVERGEAERI